MFVVAGACGHPTTSLPVFSHKGFPRTAQPTAQRTTPQPAATAEVPPAVPSPAPAPPPPPPSVQPPYEPPLPLAPADPLPSSKGPRFAVRGVERDDVLNVRAEPGPQSPVVGQIPPDTTGIASTGARRRVGPGMWREVSYANVRGWVNERFLIEERDARPISGANANPPRR
jgi:hypothetical protein